MGINYYRASDKELLIEMGHRIANERIAQRMTQQQLADFIGIGILTIKRIESGHNFSVLILIKILRALNRLESMGDFLPRIEINPLQRHTNTPKRVKVNNIEKQTTK
ncbi:hypothetical protein FACS1894199_11110 [Bacteroidia bacterium]|nr:hypothetical protein FACS1894199_11110 [Bacteroidia bacterium]